MENDISLNKNIKNLNLDNNQQVIVPVQGDITDKPTIVTPPTDEGNNGGQTTNPQTGFAVDFGKILAFITISLGAVFVTKKR